MDKKYQEALKKAEKELSLILPNNDQMTMLEIENIRNYAKARTNLNIDESKLSPEKKAWKAIYQRITELMKNTSGQETIERIDNDYQKIESLIEVRDEMVSSVILERKINNLLNEQYAVFHIFFNNEPSSYTEMIEKFSNALDDPNVTDQEKIELAERTINIFKEYEKTIINKLYQQQENIYELFIKCEKNLNNSLWEQLGCKELMEKWTELVKKIHENREKMISTIEDRINFDIQLAQITIDQKGKQLELTNEQTKKIKENLILNFTNISSIIEEEISLKKEFDPLSNQMLGDYKTYAEDVMAGLSTDADSQNTTQTEKEHRHHKNWNIYIIILIIIFMAIIISLNI